MEGINYAQESIKFSNRSKNVFWKMSAVTVLADAMHQAGQMDKARDLFFEAEKIQKDRQPEYPFLYSLQGFQYCDLLLADLERTTWQALLIAGKARRHLSTGKQRLDRAWPRWRAIDGRARKMFEWRSEKDGLLDIAHDYLTLGRVALLAAVLEGSGRFAQPKDYGKHVGLATPQSLFDEAVRILRKSGVQHHLPRALLFRAWARFLAGSPTDGARSDLDDALDYAEWGSMKLCIADVHLWRARLFFRKPSYPWDNGPQSDLLLAEKLILQHGYHRREKELLDAKEVILPHRRYVRNRSPFQRTNTK